MVCRTLVAGIGVLALGGAAAAAPFTVLTWDLGSVENAPGFFGSNIRPSTGRFFRSNLTVGTDRGPDQSATSQNRLFDSYAGFDGGSGTFSGPTVPDSVPDSGDGYSTNTNFSSVIPVGFTLQHFGSNGDRFGGGAFPPLPEASSGAFGGSQGWGINVHSFFVGRLTVQRGATLIGGVMRALIPEEGGEVDGGAVVTLALNGPMVHSGASNNTYEPLSLFQGYQLISFLSAQPNGLGNQQGVAGAFGNGDTFDVYVVSENIEGPPTPPTPGTAIAVLIGAGLGTARRRRGT